jgi:small subunit ribosomal protein S16
MVRLRLRRVGRKKQPSYRLVAAEKEAPRDGRFLEIVGFYNPRTEPATIQFKEDRIYDWLNKGAQPSDSVDKLFKTIGLWERFERFKGGEDVEKLLEEAQAAENSRTLTAKTRRPAPEKKAESKDEAEEAVKEKAAPKAEEKEEAAPAAEAEEEAVEEAAEDETAEEAAPEEAAEEAAPEADAEEEQAEE